MKNLYLNKRILSVENDQIVHEFIDPTQLRIDELVQHIESRETGYVIAPYVGRDDFYWIMLRDSGQTICHISELDLEIGAPFRKAAI